MTILVISPGLCLSVVNSLSYCTNITEAATEFLSGGLIAAESKHVTTDTGPVGCRGHCIPRNRPTPGAKDSVAGKPRVICMLPAPCFLSAVS